MHWLIVNVTVYGEAPVNVNAGELSVKDASRHEQKIKNKYERRVGWVSFDVRHGSFP